MRSTFIHLAVLFSGITLALAWAGLVCLNSGEPDFTEQFWFYGLMAFAMSHAAVIAYAVSAPKQEVVR